LFVVDLFLSPKIEPQFELKIYVLGLNIEIYPTKSMGDLGWTPIGDGNN
jgi:hypothetical protein